MRVLFRESFAKDLRNIGDTSILARIRDAIGRVQGAATLQEIPNLRRFRDASNYYRIRMGQYRIGLEIDREEVTFVRCLHRRDIYRYFP